MRIKHWAGYGTVTAKKMPPEGATLHIRVRGDHECGIHRDEWDTSGLCKWLVMKFDKNVTDVAEWCRNRPIIEVRDGWDLESDYCDYYFTY